MFMYCDLWPKSSKIELQTGLMLATLRYFYSINPGFDAEVAEKFLNGMYLVNMYLPASIKSHFQNSNY